MVCGSRRGVGIVRRREFVVVGAGLSWSAATLAPGVTCWMNRLARPSLPGRLTRRGSGPSGWRECGSRVPDRLVLGANARRTWRMRFTVTSSWAGPGGAAAGRRSWLHCWRWQRCSPHVIGRRLGHSPRDRPQDCPQESARWNSCWSLGRWYGSCSGLRHAAAGHWAAGVATMAMCARACLLPRDFGHRRCAGHRLSRPGDQRAGARRQVSCRPAVPG